MGDADPAILARAAGGDVDGATEAALKVYGGEIYGYLAAIHAAEADAEDAFALFAEDVWRGLPGFRGGSSLRTWLYTVARHAASRRARQGERHDARRAGVGVSTIASRIAAHERSQASVMRSERRSRIAELRAALPEEEQTLLILRVDRGLSWQELAQVMEGPAVEGGGEALERAAARLRKRFQLVKEKLVEQARQEGLLEE